MKRYSLLLLPLVAVVFAVSCRDSTSPAKSHALLSAKNPDLGVIGNKPPPPVDAAMTITISSLPHTAPFTGVYFSNGGVECGLAAAEVGDLTLCDDFNGTAWLRLDNKQPDFGGAASANTRFKRQNDNKSGMGTLSFTEVDGTLHVFKIVRVKDFFVSGDCGSAGETCAIITFTATDNADPDPKPEHDGDLTAVNSSGCEIVLVRGEGEVHYEYRCPPPPPPPEG